MSNEALEGCAALAVLAEAGALIWALARGDLTGIVLINLVGATGFMIAAIPGLGVSLETLDKDFFRCCWG